MVRKVLQLRGSTRCLFIIALNVGGIIGSAFWGGVSQGRLGRRGAVTCAAALGVVVSPLYLMSGDTIGLLSAHCSWVSAPTAWGAFPSYLTERFPSDVRGAGAGFCYHAGALVGSFTSYAIGHLVDTGWTLATAMTAAIAVSGSAVRLSIWLGPANTRQALSVNVRSGLFLALIPAGLICGWEKGVVESMTGTSEKLDKEMMRERKRGPLRSGVSENMHHRYKHEAQARLCRREAAQARREPQTAAEGWPKKR